MKGNQLKRMFMALAVMALTLVGLGTSPAHANNGTISYGAFPYVAPGDQYLTDLLNPTTTPNPPSFVVLNVGNGQTDDVALLDYAAQSLHARGVTVYGYVDTSFGARNLYDVMVDINRWVDPYNPVRLERVAPVDGPFVDGIFLDQTPRSCIDPNNSSVDYRGYYNDATQYVHDIFSFWGYPTPKVMANVGTAVEDCMPGYGAFGAMPDFWVTYEGNYTNYESSYLGGNVWNTTSGYYDGNFYFNDQFVHIVHSTSGTTALNDAISDADARGARHVFVTDDVYDPANNILNPYDAKPSYLNSAITYANSI